MEPQSLGPVSGPHGGTDFGKYQLLAKLGYGAMADVFLGVAQGPVGFTKLLVVKRLRRHLAEDADFLSMFLDEARLAARLNHPNVVQTYEVGDVEGEYFIAMEHLDGQPLDRILGRAAKTGAVPLEMMLRIIADALAGLHYAHELTDYDGTPLSVVHRDLSPHNLLVTYEGQTKIVDFGIAKAASRTVETLTGVMKGKIGYMAPEQARCGDVDRRADVFSIGVLLWELATGRRLWHGLTDMQVMEQLLAGNIPRIRTVKPDAPWMLDAICARALAISPADRYPSAAELRIELNRFLDQSAMRVTHEDIGRELTTLFSDSRAKLKKLLEAQMQTPQVMTHSGPAARRLSMQAPADPRSPESPLTSPTTLGSHVKTSNPPRRGGRARWSRAWWLAAAGAAGGLAAAAIWSTRSTPEPPATGTGLFAAATGDPIAQVAPPTPQPTTIEVHARASPATAEIFLDDVRLSNPHVARFPADRTEHVLRFEAPGYVTQTKTFVFEHGISVDVALEKAAPPPPPEPRVRRRPGR